MSTASSFAAKSRLESLEALSTTTSSHPGACAISDRTHFSRKKAEIQFTITIEITGSALAISCQRSAIGVGRVKNCSYKTRIYGRVIQRRKETLRLRSEPAKIPGQKGRPWLAPISGKILPGQRFGLEDGFPQPSRGSLPCGSNPAPVLHR